MTDAEDRDYLIDGLRARYEELKATVREYQEVTDDLMADGIGRDFKNGLRLSNLHEALYQKLKELVK